jgi:hypothetical protein
MVRCGFIVCLFFEKVVKNGQNTEGVNGTQIGLIRLIYTEFFFSLCKNQKKSA